MILIENIVQNNLKLIRLDNNQFVIVDLKAEIKPNTCYENNKVLFLSDNVYDEGNNPNNSNPIVTDYNNSVIFATSGLNLEGVNVIEEKEKCLIAVDKDFLRKVFNAGNAGSGGSMYNRVRKYNGVDSYFDSNEYAQLINSQAQQELYTKEQLEEAIELARILKEEKRNKISKFEIENILGSSDGTYGIEIAYSKKQIFKKLEQVKVEVDLTNNTAKFI